MKLVICDTMDYWIRESPEELKKVLQRIEMLVINDSEARLLSGYNNIVKRRARFCAWGRRWF